MVSTLAGSTAAGIANGVGTSAQFYRPFGVSVDSSGNVIVADEGNNLIRKISPTGIAACCVVRCAMQCCGCSCEVKESL